MNLRGILPTRYRKYGYLVIVALGVLHGALVAGFAAAGLDNPSWLIVGGSVFAYVATAAPIVALFNLHDTEVEAEPSRGSDLDPADFPIAEEE